MTAAVVAGGVAFLVAGALVPLLARFAVGRNLMDVPNLRSSHEVPTPRLGGVAIFCGTLVGAGLLLGGDLGVAWPLLAAAAVVWAVGLADDLGGLHFGVKAAVQAFVAAVLLLFSRPRSSPRRQGYWRSWPFSSGSSGSWPSPTPSTLWTASTASWAA